MAVRHKATIRKYWKKRQEQRRRLRPKAWGGPISATRKPDSAALRRQDKTKRQAGTTLREACVWPNINHNNFSQQKPPLPLINASARHLPMAFVAADPGEFDPFTTLAAEAPYKILAQLDLDSIESLLSARRDQAANHIRSSREDPGYFDLHIRNPVEDCIQMLGDIVGQAHLQTEGNGRNILWSKIIMTDIIHAYVQLLMWSELHRQSVNLKTMQMDCKTKIQPGDDSSDDCLKSLLHFQYWLKHAARDPRDTLERAAWGSIPWRQYFQRPPNSNATEVQVHIQQNADAKHGSDQEALIELMRSLWESEKTLHSVGITNVLHEIQHLLDTSSGAKAMVTPVTAGLIADLSLVSGCLHQIDLCQPWANTLTNAWTDHQNGVREEFAQHTKLWSRLFAARDGSEVVLIQHGAPDLVNFRYPVDAHRTRENVEAMRSAEANLDRFWAEVDRIIHRKLSDVRGTAVSDLLADSESLQRTPVWVEPVDSAIFPRCQSSVTEDIAKPQSKFGLDMRRFAKHTLNMQDTKLFGPRLACNNQVQTVMRLNLRPPSPGPSAACVVNPQPIFFVDRRALKVFKTLFFIQSSDALPGEVLWKDFLHAMSSMGFAFRKLGGSVWHFTPTRPGMRKGISFHEPHPAKKIPYQMARDFGCRLKRAYGWCGDMFRLEEREERDAPSNSTGRRNAR